LVDQEKAFWDDIQDRLAEWQQGDFTFDCAEFLFLDQSEDKNEPYEPLLDASIEGCVVISQTCDVVRDSTKIPNVTVCPLVKIDRQRVIDVEKGMAPRYGFLANVPEGFVVDFSRAMSVSKNLLISWKQNRGCTNDDELLEFATSLERFFGRFAFPDAFSDSLRSLRSIVYGKHEKNSALGRALRSIRELRVYPHEDWANKESVPVTFYLVLEIEEDRELKDRDVIWKEISEKLKGIDWVAPFSLHENEMYLTTLTDMTAAEYLGSYPLDLNALSYARRYAKA
jgi:hypothetical protein